MKLSIIIPVYNVELYIASCLDSILQQDTDVSYEVICVNDGSTDSSKKILEIYAKKYPNVVIIDQPNKGAAGARNAGITIAKGEYIWFVDSDDWIEPHAINILAKNLKGEDVLCFNGRRFFEDGTIETPDVGLTHNSLTGWEYYNKYALIGRNFHFVCVVLRIYKKEFLVKNNLCFEEHIYHEDNLFTPIMCYYASTLKVIPDMLYVYRIHMGSKQHQSNFRIISDTVLVANKLSEFFIPKKEINKKVVYREIAGEYFNAYFPERAEVYGKDYTKINKLINWNSFKEVSQYPRHKRIYWLLKINPRLFAWYLRIEDTLKRKIK